MNRIEEIQSYAAEIVVGRTVLWSGETPDVAVFDLDRQPTSDSVWDIAEQIVVEYVEDLIECGRNTDRPDGRYTVRFLDGDDSVIFACDVGVDVTVTGSVI